MWFYVHNKKAEGPVSEEILRSLLASGTLAPEVLVWREGRVAWSPARSVFDFVDLADGKGFALMGAARPPPIPGVEPADNGGSSGAEVSVEPVSVREHTSNSPPKHSPQTRRRKDGGFLWFFLPLLCLMSLLFLLLKYQAKPVPIVVPPRTVPSAQPTNSTASPRGSITPTPAPTTVANNPPSASLPPPNQPEDLFLMFKVGTMVSVAGTREGVHARMRVPQRHVFKKQKLPDGSVGSITFESDAADPALLTRLLKRYNEDFQTDITVDDGRISTIRYSVPLEKPTRYRDVQGPSFKEGWRTKVPRFSPVVFAPNQQPYWRLETSEGVITVKLMHQIAPEHVSNIAWLSAIGYYDGLTLHRAIPGFMVQGGCPFGRGSGGPGYEFAGEFDPNVKHDRAGLLSMANRGPGTDGAQFFLTFAPARYLDGKHTIFGEIYQGMDVLRSIEKLGSPSGATSKPITIIKATVEWGR